MIYGSRAKGHSASQAVGKQSHSAHNRTTALNNVSVTKTTTLKKSKAKMEDMGLLSALISFSDEDDSQERVIALNSPEKGKYFRKSSKVRIVSQLTNISLFIISRCKSRSSRTEKRRKTKNSSFLFQKWLSRCFLLSHFPSGLLTTTPEVMDGKVLITITTRDRREF